MFEKFEIKQDLERKIVTIKVTIEKNDDFNLYQSFYYEILKPVTRYTLEDNKFNYSGYMLTLEDLLKKQNGRLTYLQLQQMFICLGDQINKLERKRQALTMFELANVYVFSPTEDFKNPFFVYFIDEMYPIKETNIEILYPFDKSNKFISPELFALQEIPSYVTNKSSIYSLGKLVQYCYDVNNYNENRIGLDEIENTKLFYAVLRCIEKNPFDRFHLFI